MPLRALLRAWLSRRPHSRHSPHEQSKEPTHRTRPLLVVVEGPHDIEFLKRISLILSAHDRRLPDLVQWERRGAIIFIPFGGGDVSLWVDRLAPIGLPELHIYDRESSPETELRQRMADTVNQRPGCRAVLTSKRSLDNYLHPAAVREVCGIELEFTDDDHVADLIARRLYGHQDQVPWPELPRRTQTRRRNRVKKWLHTRVVDRMTPERLAGQDAGGEVTSWLNTIVRMVGESV
jgi:hypothetical protein